MIKDWTKRKISSYNINYHFKHKNDRQIFITRLEITYLFFWNVARYLFFGMQFFFSRFFVNVGLNPKVYYSKVIRFFEITTQFIINSHYDLRPPLRSTHLRSSKKWKHTNALSLDLTFSIHIFLYSVVYIETSTKNSIYWNEINFPFPLEELGQAYLPHQRGL